MFTLQFLNHVCRTVSLQAVFCPIPQLLESLGWSDGRKARFRECLGTLLQKMPIKSDMGCGGNVELWLPSALRRSQSSVNPGAIVLLRRRRGQWKDNSAFYTWDTTGKNFGSKGKLYTQPTLLSQFLQLDVPV